MVATCKFQGLPIGPVPPGLAFRLDSGCRGGGLLPSACPPTVNQLVDGEPTHGGYSTAITVSEEFVVRGSRALWGDWGCFRNGDIILCLPNSGLQRTPKVCIQKLEGSRPPGFATVLQTIC